MDKKEVRDYLGQNHHFKPTMNPGTTPPKHINNNNLFHKKPTQPIQIYRQSSVTSDGTPSSPVGSPASPTSFSFTEQPTFKPHLPKPNVYKSFGFSG